MQVKQLKILVYDMIDNKVLIYMENYRKDSQHLNVKQCLKDILACHYYKVINSLDVNAKRKELQ